MKFRVLILTCLIPFLLTAYTVNVEKPVMQGNSMINDLPTIAIPGYPNLSYLPLKVLLPMGEKLDNLEIIFGDNEEILENVIIDYARTPQPISKPSIDRTKKDWNVYNSNEYYPTQDYKILGTQQYKGYNLLLVNVYPYKYNPVTKQLQCVSNVEVYFETEIETGLREIQNNKLVQNTETIRTLERLIVNPGEISSYVKSSVSSSRTLVDPEDPCSLIIITDETRLPYFSEFVDWKISHGISTQIYLTTDVYNDYTGVNDQEKIKNFINDAYTTFSATDTPLEYVILGGDDEIIPIRTVYINTGNGTLDENMPCDAYYSCLDNDWDGNGNGIYGEVADDVDLIPEIAVGRITAETEDEFNRFFNKTYHYVDEVSVSDDMVYKFGENLNNDPLTWGGDYMDEILDLVPNIQEDYHIFKLYDREGTFSSYNVKEAINNGVAIMNHMGHSNETMVFGQNNSHCSTYTNTEFGFAYSQGCYPAAFDEATSFSSESIAENLIMAEGGLYAFVGNTRYGWYSPGSTNGPSQPYDIEFFKAIFTNDIRALGSALSESRVVMANEAVSNAYLRWVHYELVLFGDPSVEVKYANGDFPFIQPGDVVYDDSATGDGDGTPNPGEQIEIYIELENLEGWADATDVTASLEFEDTAIQLITGSVNYGNIQNGTFVTGAPFVVQVPQDCNYDSYLFTVTVEAPVSGDFYFTKSYDLSFEVSLYQQNWPWITDYSVMGNPIICDFDGNGSRNLLIVDAFANVHLLGATASYASGYPWYNEENIWKSSAYADIDNDGNKDIVIASRTGRIFALNNEGMELFNFDVAADQLLTPIVADIDGDGELDIVSFGIDKKIYALNADGNLLANFPVELSMLSFCEMASADLDEDGSNEILISTLAGELFAINNLGENLDGFPVNLSAASCSAPIILDNLNIVLGTNDNNLLIINPQGEIILNKDLNGQKIIVSPIAADFDNDDVLEIAFATQNGILSIIEQDGAELSGWPVNIGHSIANPPVTVDLNNDDNLNLICFSSINDLYVYNNDGTEVEFAPVPVGLIGNTPASIEDIDRDGDFEIVSGLSTGAFVIDSKLSKGQKTPWKTYRGNYQRTGYYGDNELITDAGEVIPEIAKFNLHQNFPNPFNPTTTIAFSIPNMAKIDLNIYNVKGQKVKTLISSETMDQGEQQVSWNGKDDEGKQVSTGIYFYKLRADNEDISIKKCLLLK